MGDLLLSALDERLAGALEARARQHNRSVEQEALEILRQATVTGPLSPAERVASARAIVALMPRMQTTDSVSLLREERSL